MVVDEEEEMLAIQFDAPTASPFGCVDDWGNDGPAARMHVESPGRFVRWIEVRLFSTTNFYLHQRARTFPAAAQTAALICKQWHPCKLPHPQP